MCSLYRGILYSEVPVRKSFTVDSEYTDFSTFDSLNRNILPIKLKSLVLQVLYKTGLITICVIGFNLLNINILSLKRLKFFFVPQGSDFGPLLTYS